MSMKIWDKLHWTPGINAVANAFAGTVTSDVVDAQGQSVLFMVHNGVGATGTSTFTVLAADDTTPSNTTAVPFSYRQMTTADTWGDWTAAGVAGFTSTAGSNKLIQIVVDAAELAEEGRAYAQLNAVEVVASAVLGGILVAVGNLRYSAQPTSLID